MSKNIRNYFALLLVIILAVSVGSFAILTIHSQSASASSASSDPAPSITLSPTAGPVQTPITVKGTGFTSGHIVNLYWFGFILDVPGIAGHLGYYALKTGITVPSSGNFSTTIIAPYDFSDIAHFVNATQNGVGTGITDANFTIMPTLQLSPWKAVYTEGDQILLHVYGGPLGTEAFVMGLNPQNETDVLKFTYDNNVWGFATSHLQTEGPIVTGGFTGGDIGGNITISFKAIGSNGYHDIRGYLGTKDDPPVPYLPCVIGGEVEFYVWTPPSP
jgi:hypothetical protein